LTDFGIAALLDLGAEPGQRITRTGQVLGDPRYASPEQLSGLKVTEQADVYSLGILAYEILTGHSPHGVLSKREEVTAHLSGDPRPISHFRQGISADLETLLLRCLAREPSHRPRAQDLGERLAPIQVGQSPASPGGSEGLGIVRRRIPQIVSLTIGAGAGLLGLVIGLIDIGELPSAALALTINLVAWGLLASAVLAWYHGERGKQQMARTEKWILGVLAAGWMAVTALLLVN
jgi:serine/threonine-protein kinase